MKTYCRTLFFVTFSVLFIIACSDTSTPQEGKQYRLLPATLEDIDPVTEVFSLTCGHCRSMEKYLAQISQQAQAPIGKLHITFNASARQAATLYYAAEIQLGETPDHELMDALFAAVQMGKDSTDAQRDEAIKGVFATRDLMIPAQFKQQQNSELLALVAQAQHLSTKSAINAVPTFIVKGHYQVIVAGHNSPTEIANTIRYLLNK